MGVNGDKAFAGRLEDLPVFPANDHSGTQKRVVFGPDVFWDDHVMRHFTVEAGSSSSFHYSPEKGDTYWMDDKGSC